MKLTTSIRTIILAGLLAGYAGISAQAAAPASPQGMITYRTYPGDPRNALRARDGTATADGVHYPKRAEGPYNGMNVGDGADPGDDGTKPGADIRNNYTMELEGYFYPPKTGKVQLAIASDDPGELFLSTDETPANAKRIAIEPSWNPVRAFGQETRRTIIDTGDAPVPRPNNMSAFINVTAGKPYYIHAFATEWGGGDNLAVAMRYEGDPDFQDNDLPILGKYLSTIDRPDLTKAYVSKFASSPTGFSAVISDGSGAGAASLDAASLKVQLDGADVKADIVKGTTGSTVSFAKTDGYLVSASRHAAKLTFKDTKGNNNTVDQNFTVETYGFLSKTLKVTPDTSKPGFLWRVAQNNAVGQGNSNLRTEQQLAGLLKDAAGVSHPNHADPNAQGAAIAPGKAPPANQPWAPVEFEVATTINFDQAGGSNGAFTPDEQMPGIPGIEGSADSIAAEIITYLDLPKGMIRMGVNSDDGFKTTAGNARDMFDAIYLGEFNGGRGAADTIFPIVVEEAGVYAFRVTWEEGGGGANIEWFTLKADGTKVLVNDSANGGIKAYRAAQGGSQSYLVGFTPSQGASQVPLKPTIEITWSDASGKIPQDSIKLKVAGAEVKPTIKKDGATLTATYASTTTYKNAAIVAAEANFTNDGVPKTFKWNFVTEVDLAAPGTLFIETEDFDFGKGQYVKGSPLGTTGKYAGGLYQDKGDGLGGTANSDFGIDYFEAATGTDQAIYRPQTGVEAGKLNNDNIGKFRGAFDVDVNHVVGWNDAGDWMNYTREFPTPAKNYYVFGRLSSGGAAIRTELAQVTSGQGTANQAKKKLGEFNPGRATSGWDNPGAFEIFPLVDDAGNLAVVNLGGLTTLRYTTISGNNDNDFIFFQPAPDVTTPPPPTGDVKVAVKRSGNDIVIEWTGTGTLQSADAVTGPWADVAGAASPRTVQPTGNNKFYRLKR